MGGLSSLSHRIIPFLPFLLLHQRPQRTPSPRQHLMFIKPGHPLQLPINPNTSSTPNLSSTPSSPWGSIPPKIRVPASTAFLPPNAGSPVTISYKIAPNDHMSDALDACSPLSTSGAVYDTDIADVIVAIKAWISSIINLLNPTSPLSVTNTSRGDK